MATATWALDWLFRTRWRTPRISGDPQVLRNSILWLLGNAVLASALLPYVSPIPVATTDIQFTAIIIAIGTLAALAIYIPAFLTIYKEDLIVLGLGILTLFYVNFTIVPLNMVWLRSCGGMLLAFPVYYAVRVLYRYMSPRVFIAIACLYFIVLAVQSLSPSLYLATFGRTLSAVRWEKGGIRGLNGLCPEPSQMAYIAITFIVSLYFFYRDYWRRHRRLSYFVIAISILMLIKTKSASAIMVFALVLLGSLLLSRWSAKVKVPIAAGIVALAVALGSLLGGVKGRGAEFVTSFVHDPATLLVDQSFIARVGSSYVGLLSLPSAPLGTGEIHLDDKVTNRVFNGAGLTSIVPDQKSRRFLLYYLSDNAAHDNFGYSIQRMGIFAIAVVIGLLSVVKGFREKYVVWLVLLGYLLNESIFTSSFWFIVGASVAAAHSREDAETAIGPPSHVGQVARWIRSRV